MKSQTEHINIHNFNLISELFIFTFSLCKKINIEFMLLSSEYKLTKYIQALQQSKDSTCTCMPINKIITALIYIFVKS